MNKITKKLMTGVAALSMLIPLYSAVHVSADDPNPSPVPNITRTLSVKFMGRGATPQETSPGAAKLNADDLQASNPNKQEFWVGVSVDKVNDLDLFKNGVYSVELAFEYDPSFVEPYFTSNSAESDWNKELIKGNLKGAADSDFSESTWWDSSKYEITSVFSSELDMETDSGAGVDREDADKVADRKTKGWKMCTVCVSYKPDVTFENARFTGLADDGEKFLLKLPFKVKKVPGETDLDKNPKVLSLVRGPETFNIGAGANGKTPHSTWIKTVTDWTDQSNMKTLFKDSGDISLFGAGAVIEDIDPYNPPEPTQDPDATPNPDATPKPTDKPLPDLSHTKEDLGEEGFTDGVKTYYMSVSNEEDTIQFDVVYADTPTVKVRYTDNPTDTEVSVTEVDGKKRTEPILLKELTKETVAGETKGYDNIITFSDSSTDYEIHIRRLLKPKIVLNPGNSPYGLIERMSEKYFVPDATKTDAENAVERAKCWDDEKIKQAKEAFDKSHTINKTYGKDADGNLLIPTGGQTEFNYVASAWEKHDKNYDEVDEATFVYEASTFTDPGVIIYDQLGDLVENPTITKTLTIRKIDSGTVPTYDKDEGEDRSLEERDIDGVKKYNLSGIVIRPDKYEIEYLCTYKDLADGQTQTLEATRPLIILSKRGDVQLTTSVLFNSNDAIFLQNTWSSLRSRSMLFSFRIADIQITSSPLMNSNDAIELTNKWSRLRDGTQFYTTIN